MREAPAPRRRELLPCTFEYAGTRLEAFLTHVSGDEARFEYRTPRPPRTLRPGLRLVFDIETPRSLLRCTGVVKWVHDEPRRYSWAATLDEMTREAVAQLHIAMWRHA